LKLLPACFWQLDIAAGNHIESKSAGQMERNRKPRPEQASALKTRGRKCEAPDVSGAYQAVQLHTNDGWLVFSPETAFLQRDIL